MNRSEQSASHVEISNLGGIDRLEMTVPPGVNILAGENATNRSSFLKSVAAALGGDESAVSLKSDADEGSVRVEIGEMTGDREYRRNGGTVQRMGSPITTESELVDTYVSIFATNPARSAIRHGGEGLRDILMRGVDTSAISERIRSLKRERDDLERELADIEQTKSDLPALREREHSLENDLETVEAEIETIEAEIETYESTTEEIEAAKAHLEELERLRDKLGRVEREITTTEESLAEYEDEKADLTEALDDVSIPVNRRTELEDELNRIETDIADTRSTVRELSDIIANNQSIIEGEEAIAEFNTSEDVAAKLNPKQATVECWTCGTEVNRSKIETRIETLESIRQEKNDELQERKRRKSEIESEIADIQTRESERSQLKTELREVERTIESERDALEELNEEAERLEAEISQVETRVEETEELRESDLPAAYQRLSKKEHERGTIESKLQSVRSTIDEKEAQIGETATIEEQLDECRDELEKTRGEIDRIERDLVDQFNTQMEDLIDLLDYENISRVWLERLSTDEGSVSAFDIHVVRESADGTVYEDSLENLSESEREIIGIVVALSGYLVHDLAEAVPMVLFDSIESIDATRLENLFRYINEYAPTIVAALLPEDAAAVSEHTIEQPFAN
ncbi:DNA sulfur modification protein DndD, ATPase [Halanaeroarchaeum sp. HSR-CO]|uniref:archaea-specific SMC-related protein n=1 Tax=Halanaeroarchaeum sp. HSR-CO TaxID=2866382 RepID=UPI00217E761F|nr:archaea-specific SMC-related protein [Halanaeroarchaeum sp. HSR-CO]UWG46323.1 DNA sulfur modification protein DndD, ATPase [Halanaeroarchaeum sp. HSR-CO]